MVPHEVLQKPAVHLSNVNGQQVVLLRKTENRQP